MNRRRPTAVLLPEDPLEQRVVDDHYSREKRAAQELGLTVKLANIENLLMGQNPLKWPPFENETIIVYRGWMLSDAHYKQLSDSLTAKNARLYGNPMDYRKAHHMSEWVDFFSAFTPKTFIPADESPGAIGACLDLFEHSPLIIRSNTKSFKEYWDSACFIPRASDRDQALKVIGRFIELRDDTGLEGILFRAFEKFVGAELRSWWINGKHVLTTTHPNSPEEGNPLELTIPVGFEECVFELGCPFITADFVRNENGQWRLVEIGDGGVSDLPPTVAPDSLYSKF